MLPLFVMPLLLGATAIVPVIMASDGYGSDSAASIDEQFSDVADHGGGHEPQQARGRRILSVGKTFVLLTIVICGTVTAARLLQLKTPQLVFWVASVTFVCMLYLLMHAYRHPC